MKSKNWYNRLQKDGLDIDLMANMSSDDLKSYLEGYVATEWYKVKLNLEWSFNLLNLTGWWQFLFYR